MFPAAPFDTQQQTQTILHQRRQKTSSCLELQAVWAGWWVAEAPATLPAEDLSAWTR